jgi:hypothetical protein
VSVFLWTIATDAITIAIPMVQNSVVGGQASPDMTAYFNYMVANLGGARLLQTIHFVTAITLFLIWFSPTKKGIQSFVDWIWTTEHNKIRSAILVFSALLLAPHDAHAYRASSDYSELLMARPSWTVFLIPMMGDNVTNQKQLEGEEFYKAKKVSAKYVIIPHGKLSGTGAFVNDVINTSTAVVVDHQPYARVYSPSIHRGTSLRDEGIHCETKNSHNITTGIGIGVVIKEEDAAKYVYHFNADMNNPIPTSQSEGDNGKDKTFISAVAAKALPDVMDNFGFRIIQTTMCDQYASRTTDAAIEEKDKIISKAREEVTKALGEMGITVITFGFAEPQTLSPAIQTAIDDVYVAQKQKAAADAISSAIPTMEAQARIKFVSGLAAAAEHGHLPALPSIIGGVPSELMAPLKDWLGAKH